MTDLFRVAPLAVGIGCTSVPKGTASDTATSTGGDEVDVIGILITPDEVIVPVGGTLQLEAIGLNADRESFDLTDVVEWHAAAPDIAEVSNSLSEEGMLYGLSPGSTSIAVRIDDVVSPPGRVIVTDANLTDLTITPPSVVIGIGDTIQLAAEARFSDGESADASSQVRWITTDGEVATLSSTGELTGAGAGETTVHVEWNDVSSEDITVTVAGSTSDDMDVDLSIADVYASIEGSALNVWVDVENLGSTTAAGFWIDLFIDPETTPTYGDWPDAYNECSYVGPKETSTVLIQAYAMADFHDLFLVVDSTDDIVETSESNNTAWAEAESGDVSTDGEPNLVIDYFSWFVYDDVTEYSIYVTNTGLGDAGSFYVDVFHDSDSEPVSMSTGDSYTLVPELVAGATEYVVLTVEDDCVYCTSWALADSFDQVEESDEADNTARADVGADTWK